MHVSAAPALTHLLDLHSLASALGLELVRREKAVFQVVHEVQLSEQQRVHCVHPRQRSRLGLYQPLPALTRAQESSTRDVRPHREAVEAMPRCRPREYTSTQSGKRGWLPLCQATLDCEEAEER